jgi:anti-anti-sigma factor
LLVVEISIATRVSATYTFPIKGAGAGDVTDIRRSSRADRRRQNAPFAGPDRRKGIPDAVRVYSQIVGSELQIFVQDPITAASSMSAREALLRHCQRSRTGVVVMDLEKATYLDTPGLSMLFDLKKEINSQGRAFYLQNPSRCVQRMLNLTRMVRLFPVRFSTQSDVHAIPTARAVTPLAPASSAPPAADRAKTLPEDETLGAKSA